MAAEAHARQRADQTPRAPTGNLPADDVEEALADLADRTGVELPADAADNVPSLRTLGPGEGQAASGVAMAAALVAEAETRQEADEDEEAARSAVDSALQGQIDDFHVVQRELHMQLTPDDPDAAEANYEAIADPDTGYMTQAAAGRRLWLPRPSAGSEYFVTPDSLFGIQVPPGVEWRGEKSRLTTLCDPDLVGTKAMISMAALGGDAVGPTIEGLEFLGTDQDVATGLVPDAGIRYRSDNVMGRMLLQPKMRHVRFAYFAGYTMLSTLWPALTLWYPTWEHVEVDHFKTEAMVGERTVVVSTIAGDDNFYAAPGAFLQTDVDKYIAVNPETFTGVNRALIDWVSPDGDVAHLEVEAAINQINVVATLSNVRTTKGFDPGFSVGGLMAHIRVHDFALGDGTGDWACYCSRGFENLTVLDFQSWNGNGGFKVEGGAVGYSGLTMLGGRSECYNNAGLWISTCRDMIIEGYEVVGGENQPQVYLGNDEDFTVNVKCKLHGTDADGARLNGTCRNGSLTAVVSGASRTGIGADGFRVTVQNPNSEMVGVKVAGEAKEVGRRGLDVGSTSTSAMELSDAQVSLGSTTITAPGRTVTDGMIGTAPNILTALSANFVTNDRYRPIKIVGAGPGGMDLDTQIVGVVGGSPSTVRIAHAATLTEAENLTVVVGSFRTEVDRAATANLPAGSNILTLTSGTLTTWDLGRRLRFENETPFSRPVLIIEVLSPTTAEVNVLGPAGGLTGAALILVAALANRSGITRHPITVTDRALAGSMASGSAILTTAAGVWTRTDQGAKVTVPAAGNAGGTISLTTYVKRYMSSSQVELADTCKATAGVAGVTVNTLLVTRIASVTSITQAVMDAPARGAVNPTTATVWPLVEDLDLQPSVLSGRSDAVYIEGAVVGSKLHDVTCPKGDVVVIGDASIDNEVYGVTTDAANRIRWAGWNNRVHDNTAKVERYLNAMTQLGIVLRNIPAGERNVVEITSGTTLVANRGRYLALNYSAPATLSGGVDQTTASSDPLVLFGVSGNVTVPHGSVFMLNGSADWTIPVGGTLTLVQLQPGVWWEAARSTPTAAVASTGLTVRTAVTGSFTPALGDANSLIPINAAGANTFTIPTDASVPFPVGTVLALAETGGGQTTVAPESGAVTLTTMGNRLKLEATGAQATFVKIATNSWLGGGNLVT